MAKFWLNVKFFSQLSLPRNGSLCPLKSHARCGLFSSRSDGSSRSMSSGFKWTPPEKTTLGPKVKMPEFYDGTTFAGPVPVDRLQTEFMCSSGAGGQSVNKTASKARISFNVHEAGWLPKWIRHKLIQSAKPHMNKAGFLTVYSDSFRSQDANLKDALRKIESLIEDAAKLPKPRSDETERRILKGMHRRDMNRLRDKKYGAAKKRERRGDD